MRRVVQIAATDNNLYALCEDGTIWNWNHVGEWKEWPVTSEIPVAKVTNPHKFKPGEVTPGPKSGELTKRGM